MENDTLRYEEEWVGRDALEAFFKDALTSREEGALITAVTKTDYEDKIRGAGLWPWLHVCRPLRWREVIRDLLDEVPRSVAQSIERKLPSDG